MVGIWLSSTSVRAADITWTNGSSTYETNSNWSPSTVPTLNDRAIFSDSAASSGYTVSFGQSESIADVLFSAVTKTVNWKVGSSSPSSVWTVSNSFVFDEGTSGTATGTLASGNVTVTNASGTGAFMVGNNTTKGRGLFKMELANQGVPAPTLIVDQFTMTTNSDFFFRAGTLTTQWGSTISRGTQTGFCIGTNSGSTGGVAYWNMVGGTNSITFSSGGSTYLGYQSTTTGGVFVTGPNTLWSVGGSLLAVGNSGVGSLIISNGAHVTCSEFLLAKGSSSTGNLLTVTGSGSRLDVNSTSENSFGSSGASNQTYVTAGAVVMFSNTGSATLGNGSFSTSSQMTVSGTNSLVQVGGGFHVGIHSSGNTLTITNAGAVALVGSGSLTIGGDAVTSSNNLVKVSGGSLVVNSATLTVGNHGFNSALTLDNNGTVTVNGGNLYVSASSDALGSSVTVSGGSLAVTNSGGGAVLDVNHSTGTASFMLNGGTVTADRLLVHTGGTFTFKSGVLNVTGNVGSNSVISNGALFTVGDNTQAATLNLAAGEGFSAGNGLQISSNALLTGIGTITGSTASSGTISPGHSAGTLAFAGNLTLSASSVLAIEIGGLSPGQSDLLVVTNGAFSVNGTLSVSLINGFSPSSGESIQLFDLSSCTSTSGAFAAFNLPSLGDGLSWDTSQLLVTGDLNVVPEPSSLVLVVSGCCMLAWLGSRRRSHRQEPHRGGF